MANYKVIDCLRCNQVDSEHDDFNDAMNRCLDLAMEQADDDEDVDTFINGDNPETNPCGNWMAGACPNGDTGGYWPHVEYI